jgi:hypothetical protein
MHAKQHAGFMEAPDIDAKKSMSKPTIPPPIANPQNFSSHCVVTIRKMIAIIIKAI